MAFHIPLHPDDRHSLPQAVSLLPESVFVSRVTGCIAPTPKKPLLSDFFQGADLGSAPDSATSSVVSINSGSPGRPPTPPLKVLHVWFSCLFQICSVTSPRRSSLTTCSKLASLTHYPPTPLSPILTAHLLSQN